MIDRFVSGLRTRPGSIYLAGEHAAALWTVRVQGAEVWDAVRVVVVADTPVREVKRAAMAELMPDVDAIDGYVVKLRGIEIHDESQTVQAAGATDGSALLVMSRRRQPVR